MRKKLSIIFSLIAWFTIITQFILMMNNRATTPGETIIRFFSYFTILTNTLVAVYFTAVAVGNKIPIIHKAGTLTAITVYITVVGLVYQVLLRHTWAPTGMQKLVDELLHSIVPVLVIIYWYLVEKKKEVTYIQLPRWLVYPFIYLIYILVRGNASGFYPYPFVNVAELGMQKVLLNSFFILLFFVALSLLFIKTGKMIAKDKKIN